MGKVTIYTDKNDTKICVGDKLKDVENFEWEVVDNNGSIEIECLDIPATESVYPRAKFCEIIT